MFRSAMVVVGMSVQLAAVAAAQVVESPVPFDRDGRILVVSPPLVARLDLRAPAWPVTGSFREARLFQSGASYVLVVERPAGVNERHPLDAAQVEALRAAVADAVQRTGRPIGEDRPDLMVSLPARGELARNQTTVAATLYGPAVAALLQDAPTLSGASYLLVTGGTFFYTYSASRNSPITRAQNHLSFRLAYTGAAGAAGTVWALTGNREEKSYWAAALAGGIGGTLAGLRYGRPLTEAEATAATSASLAVGLTTLGAMVAAGWDGGDARPQAVVLTAALGAGLPVGLRYARRASYTVTAGDIGALSTASALGALASVPLLGDDPSENAAAATLTAGFLAGIVLGDRLLVRPFDYSTGESRMLALGATAGGTVGLGVAALAETSDLRATSALMAGGAVAGLWLTHSLLKPTTGPARAAPPRGPGRGGLSLAPTGAAMAAAGVPGRHPLVSFTF